MMQAFFIHITKESTILTGVVMKSETTPYLACKSNYTKAQMFDVGLIKNPTIFY